MLQDIAFHRNSIPENQNDIAASMDSGKVVAFTLPHLLVVFDTINITFLTTATLYSVA